MNNLPLKPLVWDWSYGDGGKTNAVCRAKSPSHEYIVRLEAGGDCYVDYRRFDNDEDADNRKDEPPVFDSIRAAQDWVETKHYPSKMQPYVKLSPTWIDASKQLPNVDRDTQFVCAYDSAIDTFSKVAWFNADIGKFDYQHGDVLAWMPIPEFKQGE